MKEMRVWTNRAMLMKGQKHEYYFQKLRKNDIYKVILF